MVATTIVAVIITAAAVAGLFSTNLLAQSTTCLRIPAVAAAITTVTATAAVEDAITIVAATTAAVAAITIVTVTAAVVTVRAI